MGFAHTYQTYLGALAHLAYEQWVKLPRYNCRIAVPCASTVADAARLLIRFNPQWTKQDHEELAKAHGDAAKECAVKWDEEVERASMETYGRPYRITDYQISGIARDEYGSARKDALHLFALGKTYHNFIGRAHAEAARKLGRKRRVLLRQWGFLGGCHA